jgi:hypothetical protein
MIRAKIRDTILLERQKWMHWFCICFVLVSSASSRWMLARFDIRGANVLLE